MEQVLLQHKIDKIKISPFISIREALKCIAEGGEGILFVSSEDNALLGTLTDGDIRRWILSGGGLEEMVNQIYNNHPVYVYADYDIEVAKKLMLDHRIGRIPVVDKNKKILDVLTWNYLFGNDTSETLKKKIDNVHVVIMAGGKGTRLDPFTKILPKPLIPIGQETILDIIMRKFSQYGIDEFYISINHKARMIKSYFEEIDTQYKVHYVEEDKPLGTIGSLKLLSGKVDKTLMVSNCDIIIDCDYSEVLKFHHEKNFDLTLVGSYRHYEIPYGICEIESGGLLKEMVEKPGYDCLVNTGMYVLNADVIESIPDNQKFNINDLIESLKNQNKRIGVFPISEKAWTDIGQWEEYRKVVKNLIVE